MSDEDRFVRTTAAESLGELGSGSAVPALIKALNDKELEVCAYAAMALGKIGDSRTVPNLIKILEEPSPRSGSEPEVKEKLK